jgi:hypothetical protein
MNQLLFKFFEEQRRISKENVIRSQQVGSEFSSIPTFPHADAKAKYPPA